MKPRRRHDRSLNGMGEGEIWTTPGGNVVANVCRSRAAGANRGGGELGQLALGLVWYNAGKGTWGKPVQRGAWNAETR